MVRSPAPPSAWLRNAVSAVIVVGVWLIASSALAAVAIPTPAGWSTRASAAAKARAAAWAEGAGGTVQTVYTTAGSDGELLVVIDMPGRLPTEALVDGDDAHNARLAALLYDAQALFDIERPPNESGRVEHSTPGAAVVHGRWYLDDETFLLAVAPTGRTHAAVVMVLPKRSRVLYEAKFDALLTEFRGVSAPFEPFPRGSWLTTALIGWLLAAALVTTIVAIVIGGGQRRTVGRVTALILAGLGLVVWFGVYAALSDRQVELSTVGLSPAWMALEMAAAGIALGLLVFISAAVLDGQQTRVSSAPTDGAFASRPASTSRPIHVGAPPADAGPDSHADVRPTPIVGVPILPPTANAPVADDADRPQSTSGTVVSAPPIPSVPLPGVTVPPGTTTPTGTTTRTPSLLPKRPTGELPANLVAATDVEVDVTRPSAPVVDAPGPIPPPVGAPALTVPEPGTPLPVEPDHSGPASLETEQILIDRGGRGGVGKRRSFED